MPRPRSICRIYVIFFPFSSYFHYDKSHNLMSTDTLVPLFIFYLLLFFDANVDEECK